MINNFGWRKGFKNIIYFFIAARTTTIAANRIKPFQATRCMLTPTKHQKLDFHQATNIMCKM